jgi:hypothetical protein
MYAVSTRAGRRRINGSEARSQVMISAGEIRNDNGQIQFSLTVLETTQPRPKLKWVDANPASSFTPNRIDLSGSQVLAGCLSAFCSVGLLLWAFLHLWLFEQ